MIKFTKKEETFLLQYKHNPNSKVRYYIYSDHLNDNRPYLAISKDFSAIFPFSIHENAELLIEELIILFSIYRSDVKSLVLGGFMEYNYTTKILPFLKEKEILHKNFKKIETIEHRVEISW